MIRFIAIDDEPRALQVIRDHAERVSFATLLATFTNPFEAVEYVATTPVDLALLDIHMPDIAGTELVRLFNPKPLLIFTTAHSEYALQSYELDAIDYLLKPFDFPRFLKALTKAQQRLNIDESVDADFIFVNTGHQRQRIDFTQLLYVEGQGNYVRYCLEDSGYLVRASIKETRNILPTHQFVQIHRSYIVALRAIERIEENRVFVAGTSIPIGATYRTPFLERIERFQG